MRKVEPTFDRFFAEWQGVVRVRGESFVCSNCSADAAPHAGYRTNSSGGTHPMILICPRCQYPTLLVSKGVQIPGAPLGRLVEFLPPNVERFYSEARRCGTVDGWSAVALLCRTLLMHVAVDKAVAKEGDQFAPCVDGLDAAGWVPTGGKSWLDAVRRVGNKAAHKADPVTKDEATMIMHFVELLLRNVYEAPGKFAPASPAPAGGTSSP